MDDSGRIADEHEIDRSKPGWGIKNPPHLGDAFERIERLEESRKEIVDFFVMQDDQLNRLTKRIEVLEKLVKALGVVEL